MTPVEAIREMRNLLFERGWTQGAAEAADGSLCLVGAACVVTIGMARPSMEEWWQADHECRNLRDEIEYLLDRPVPRGITTWNDMPGRTFDEVVELLDRAEKHAEMSEVVA